MAALDLEIVPREEWKARRPERIHRIDTPTDELWLHHTGGNERGAAGMRQIQAFHMDTKGWSDIAYSVVIDADDLTIYEGRGIGIAGGHTQGHNTISHAICVMGNFQDEEPSDELLDLIATLVALGHRDDWWPRQLTGGHQDASGASTACPGRNLQELIPTINARAIAPPAAVKPAPILTPAIAFTLTESAMPLPTEVKFTWSLDDLPAQEAIVAELFELYHGEKTDPASLVSWGKDLAEKLAKGTDPRPTTKFIQWALQHPAEAAKL